jgi:cysteine-rich repeat protein
VVSGASRTIAIDTRGLADDGASDIAMCLGRAPTGPDAFFRITAAANERWHFHYRHVGDVDPALYVLGTCDLRVCMDNQVVDLCQVGADEHLTFQPSVAGSYIVGVDAYGAEGLTGSLEVYRPTCGNGMREHSETCDDGDLDPGDGCDEQCRDEITNTLTDRGELEVNDDFFSANHALYTPGTPMLITGRIATACESDWFVVDLPSTSSLAAQMRTMADASCVGSLDVPDPFTLQLIAADGLTRVATGAIDAGGCPGIDPTRETVAATLAAGRYFLRVFGAVDTGRRFDYGLSLTITPR